MKWVVPQTLNIISTDLTDTINLTDNDIASQVTKTNSLTVTLNQGITDTISLLGLEAKSVQIDLLDVTTQSVIKTYEIETLDEAFEDIWGYFYDDFLFKSDIVVDLILTYNMLIKVTVLNNGSTAKLGKIVVGRASKNVEMLVKHTPGMTDYTTIERTNTGTVTITEGYFAKKMSFTIVIDTSEYSRMVKRLYAIRGKSVLFIGDGGEHTIVYGIMRDFDSQYEFANKNYIGLSIEGII
ncbi:MAG: hypothetical protein ACMV1B_08280 [Prevotella sp.]